MELFKLSLYAFPRVQFESSCKINLFPDSVASNDTVLVATCMLFYSLCAL